MALSNLPTVQLDASDLLKFWKFLLDVGTNQTFQLNLGQFKVMFYSPTL